MRHEFQLVFSFLLITFFTFSQSNTLVIFSEDPTPFFVVVDGVKKNEQGSTRVSIPGIEQSNSSVKVFFEDEGIEPISKNIWWEEAYNDEVSYRIVSTKRGYKLRFFSIKKRPAAPVTTSTPPPTQSVQSTTTVTETTTVNRTNNNNNSNSNGASLNMSINVNESSDQSSESSENVNFSMNVNVNETEGKSNASNSANANINMNVNVNETEEYEEVTTTTTTTTTNEKSSGCNQPERDIYNIMSAIKNEDFDDEKMLVAKQATANSCLSVDQIKQIMAQFNFDKEKLDFAKYGYQRCFNPDDYYQLNSAFDFGSEKEELDRYIKSQKGQ